MAKAASPRTTTAPKSGRRQSQNMQECKIILLDGEVVEVPVDRRVKAADLIERAHSEVDVAEKDFFSLFFLENNQKVFLDPLRPVKDQLPSTMKDVWCLNYGVKYYISDPSFLQEDISRYLCCLQLCRDIKENRVFIDRETAARLTALMLQATLGDYDPSEHKPGFTKAFKDFILIPLDDLPENYEQKLTTLMQVKEGYSPAQAEAEFLQISKTLPRYGMQLFAARKAPSEGGKVVLIGLSHRGISVIEGHSEEYKTFPWTNIAKISYKRYTFVIRYREGGGEAEASNKKAQVRVMKLHCGLPPQSKRIWKAAVEQHTFFRLHAPERVSRLQSVFRRGTKFRFSGRTFQQVKNSTVSRDAPNFARTYSERLHRNPRKEFAPGFVPARNSFRSRKVVNKQFVIGKEDVHDREWMILSAPPVDDSPMLDNAALEEKNVHVRVRVKDGLPETTHRFRLVQKDGKYQLEEIVVIEEKEEERIDNSVPMMNGSNTGGRKVSMGLNQSFEEEPKSKILMKLPPIMSAEEEAANQVGKFLMREERLMAAAIAAEDRENGGLEVSAAE